MTDQFPSIEKLIEAILPCIERHAEGRNELTRRRREAILMFFDHFVVLRTSELPEAVTLLETVFTVSTLYAA